MIDRMLGSDLVMIIGCATVLLMLVADFIYTEYLYHKPHKDEYHRKNKKRSDNW
jgi:hypothetical protein